MSKFISIEYVGTHSELVNFLKSKELLFENKQIGKNKVFMKVPSMEVYDEIKFLEGSTPLEEGKNFTMPQVKEITESEYSSTAENGFELIHPNDNKMVNEIVEPKVEQNVQPVVQPVVTPVVQPIVYPNLQPTVQPANEQGFPQPLIEAPKKTQQLIPESQDVRERIGMALTNTSLPSKSPLSPDDPFVFLTSGSYLRNFIVASTVLLFVLTLLD